MQAPAPTPAESHPAGPVDRLVRLLDVERLDDNLFRSLRQEEGWKRVYGGQVLGQALAAAQKTAPDGRSPHSLHAYFLLPGDPSAPIIYQVERARDGGSFSTRRVVAIQHGRPIFNLSTSLQIAEAGFEHQAPMPDVPGPEGLEDEVDIIRRHIAAVPESWRGFLLRPRAVEVRPVGGAGSFLPQMAEPTRRLWFRVAGRLPDDPGLHRAALAYISDAHFVTTAILPHGQSFLDPRLQLASLDHAMWFHADARADEWLLYAMDSPSAGGARGLTFGHIYTCAGRLVASVAQEGLMRLRN
jgi:acyl-CoA thioesterase-2